MTAITGLHHITCISGDAQENVDFYSGVLGMRMVKRSVNQDSPGTYHLFYADGDGPSRNGHHVFPVAGNGAGEGGRRSGNGGLAGGASRQHRLLGRSPGGSPPADR